MTGTVRAHRGCEQQRVDRRRVAGAANAVSALTLGTSALTLGTSALVVRSVVCAYSRTHAQRCCAYTHTRVF